MSDQRYSDDELLRRDIPSFIEPRPPLITHPLLRPRPQKGTNLLELFEEDTESEETELLQVYLRLKPCKEINDLYEMRSDKCFITSMDTTTAGHGRRTQHSVSKMYTFSKIFGSESTQKEIFEAVVKDNLKKLPEGHSFTLLTYGASGSGKTYTLMGTVSSPGLVPRALEYVFKLIDASQQPAYKPAEGGGEELSYADQKFELQWVKSLRQVSMPLHDRYRRMSSHLNSYMSVSSVDLSNRRRHYVWVSFVEIYNEAVYDLLSPPEKRTKLRIREDSSGNVYVKGATQAFVRSGEEAYDVMVAGKHNLVVASTGIHAHSSRSHCIFTITMLTETESGIRSSCVRLCDLAGCERARATGNTGARMAESRAINSSLHVLERCLHSLRNLQRLRQRQKHRADPIVPYRESKLTRLLGSALSGSQGEAVSMVVTLNPATRYANETKHVLSLAAVAQDIQVNNTVLTSTFGISTTQEDTTIDTSVEVMRLRTENERLHYELALAHSSNKDLKAAFDDYRQKMSDTMAEVVEETKDIQRHQYEAQIKSLKDEMNEIVEEYESRLTETIAPVSSTRVSQCHLQTKVAELMSEIAVLEEKLTAERLARSRAEKEVEYLRNYIDEKYEIAFKYNGSENEDDVVILSASEHGSDDETDDPLHESLEPVFKMANLNKTQQKFKNDDILQSIKDNSVDNECGNSTTIVNNDLSGLVLINNANDDDNYRQRSSDETIQNMENKINNFLPAVDPNEKFIKEEEPFDVDSYISQARRYSIDEISKSSVIDDKKLNKLNLQRGNYCLATNTELPEDSFDVKVKENLKNNNDDFNVDEDKTSYTKPLIELSKDSIDVEVKDNLQNRANNVSTDKNEIKLNYIKPTIEFPKSSSDVKVEKTSEDIAENLGMDNGNIKINNNIIPTISQSKTDTLVNKIIQSCKTKQCRDDSLSQFEQLELATKSSNDEGSAERNGNFGEIKILKNKRNYFGDATSYNSNKFLNNIKLFNEICKPLENKVSNRDPNGLLKMKRIYFDNIDVGAETTKRKIDTETTSENIIANSTSNNFEPRINKIHFEEAGSSKPTENFFATDKLANVLNASLDVFCESDSPIIIKPTSTMSNVEKAQKSIDDLVLNHNANANIKTIESDPIHSVENISKSVKQFVVTEYKMEPTISIEPEQDKEISSNTIVEFDNIYKTTTHRATEFDLLFSNELSTTINTEKNNYIETELKPATKNIHHEDNARYGLRNRLIPKTIKKSLRLRKRKDQNEDEVSDREEMKLKDIGNLQQEFSDITIDVPAVRKEVKDINSPEKVIEEENVPPELGIRTCPAKSVTRSRRKLFTPQVEPLDESLGHTGDSNERIRVPRPSYHRGKARRKL